MRKFSARAAHAMQSLVPTQVRLVGGNVATPAARSIRRRRRRSDHTAQHRQMPIPDVLHHLRFGGGLRLRTQRTTVQHRVAVAGFVVGRVRSQRWRTKRAQLLQTLIVQPVGNVVRQTAMRALQEMHKQCAQIGVRHVAAAAAVDDDWR